MGKITLTEIDPSLHIILSSAGWSAGRAVDIVALEGVLTARGISISPTLREIIANFDGLTLAADRYSWLQFCLSMELEATSDEEFEYLHRIAGEPVCPLGQAPNSDFFGTASGSILCVDQDWLFVLKAKNLNDFFCGILLRDKSRLQTVWLTDAQRPTQTG